MLQLANLCKSFHQPDGDIHVLEGVNFILDAGRSAALLGESGSGKSTMLHLIAGLDIPDSGDIIFQQRRTAQFSDNDWNEVRRSQLSLVFQQYHLVPTLTATGTDAAATAIAASTLWWTATACCNRACLAAQTAAGTGR